LGYSTENLIGAPWGAAVGFALALTLEELELLPQALSTNRDTDVAAAQSSRRRCDECTMTLSSVGWTHRLLRETVLDSVIQYCY
jgi:hypothetical protein